MGLPNYLTCLLRNLYAGQETAVRTGDGTTDWFQIGKGARQGCIFSSCLFNFYAEYILRDTGLDEAQAGIKIAGRNINNLRYADDTTLKAKEERESDILRLNIKKKNKIMVSSPIIACQIEGGKVEIVTDFLLLGSKITVDVAMN